MLEKLLNFIKINASSIQILNKNCVIENLKVEDLKNITLIAFKDEVVDELPKEIKELINLKELYCIDNNLTSIPIELFELKNLEYLDLSLNKIVSIPKEIENLNTLSTLKLAGNKITSIPKEIIKLNNLKELNLSFNQISSIPKEFKEFKNLEKLALYKNKIKNTPDEILYNQSPKEIIEFILKRKDKTIKLNEAKILFVGEGGVGKTSLINRILKNYYNPNEFKTDGIDIKKFKFEYKQEEITLNLWDFGGQEIMHSTHQFFLTNRSLYILVWNASIEENIYNSIEYWLELIKSFAKDSIIFIVMNKSDEIVTSIDNEFLREKYQNIRGFYNISCKNNIGINELVKDIKNYFFELPYIKEELPISWLLVKDKLEELKKQNIDFISYDDYKNLCKNENIIKLNELNSLTLLLHDLGIILHFLNHEYLKEIIIINPLWITEGIYKILNSKILINKKGFLNLQNLENIFEYNRDKYPNSKDILLIDMMIKFELCFKIDENNFLIPEALPKETPKLNHWNKENSLAFEYHYNFLPQSIISRFIVKSHKMINKSCMWRSGVILQKNDIKALIQADRKDKKIFIYIDSDGFKAKEFLAIIRNKFSEIHKTIKTIEPKEKIPLPDNHKIVVDYEHLLFLENEKIKIFFPEGANRKYNISKLLQNIENSKNIENRKSFINKPLHIDGDIYNVNIGNNNYVVNNFGKELNTKLLELIESIQKSEIKDKDEIIESLQNAKDESSLKTTLLNLMQRGAEVGSILSGIAGVIWLL